MSTSNNKGSITIFVALIIPIIITFFFSMIDFTRIVGARNQVNMAASNAIESSLGNYDSDLYENYGLLAFNGNDEMKSEIREVIRKNLYTDDNYTNSFYGFEISDSDIDVEFRGNLFNKDVLEEQMIRAMKYQGPTNLVLGALTKFTELGKVAEKSDAANDLEKLNKTIAKFEKKLEDIEDAKKALMDIAIIYFKNYSYIPFIPKYVDSITGVEWSSLAEGTKNFIYQCAVYGMKSFDLKGINISNALTIKYMKYIITAYDKYPLPEVEIPENGNGEDAEVEVVKKNEELLSSMLSNELDNWTDDLIDKFKSSLDFDGVKNKLQKGIEAIEYINENKSDLDSKIAQYENTHLTAKNLGETYYQNIKKDIDEVKSKLGSLSLKSLNDNFKNGQKIVDIILSNVATYSSRMDEIESTIGANTLTEKQYKELENYFKSTKASVGLGENDSISKEKYIEIAKKMVKGLQNNDILKNSLSTQLTQLKNMTSLVTDKGIDGIVFNIDPVTTVTEGAKNFWNYFKKLKLNSNSLTSILSNLPGDKSIDSSIVSGMPSNYSSEMVPKDMTIDEYNNSINNDGLFETNGGIGVDSSIFKIIADLMSSAGNELMDQAFLVEYIMTNFKGMVDTDTRMPVEYSGDTILENEIEAIINNVSTYSDFTNKSIMTTKITAVRYVLNLISLLNDSNKMNILRAVETAGNWLFGLGSVTKWTVILGWTAIETRYDLMDILRGYEVPLIKNSREWVSDFSIDGKRIEYYNKDNFNNLIGSFTEVNISVEVPELKDEPYNKPESVIVLDYTDMLRIQLLASSKDKLVSRAGNLIYANLNDSNRHFDSREYFVGIKTALGSDIKKWFNVDTFNANASNGGFKINKIEIDKGYD